jgi:hypothetical protein
MARQSPNKHQLLQVRMPYIKHLSSNDDPQPQLPYIIPPHTHAALPHAGAILTTGVRWQGKLPGGLHGHSRFQHIFEPFYLDCVGCVWSFVDMVACHTA